MAHLYTIINFFKEKMIKFHSGKSDMVSTDYKLITYNK